MGGSRISLVVIPAATVYRALFNFCIFVWHHSRRWSGRHSFPSVFDAAEKYISLIVPAYNEEDRMQDMLREVTQYEYACTN